MVFRLLLARIGFGALMLLAAFGLGSCSGNVSDVFTTVPVAPTAVPATVETTVNTSDAAMPALPKTLTDVTSTQVFRFRVDPAQTTVEYAVREDLLGINQITRGRTNAVDGEFQLYMQNGKAFIALSNLEVDLRTLTSDSNIRDQAIRVQWLESNKYPKALFVASSFTGLPAGAAQGKLYSFQVNGDMTIRNITRPVTFDVTTKVQDDKIMGEGTTVIKMKDFGFDPPNVVGQTIVSDPVTLTVKGVADLVP